MANVDDLIKELSQDSGPPTTTVSSPTGGLQRPQTPAPAPAPTPPPTPVPTRPTANEAIQAAVSGDPFDLRADPEVANLVINNIERAIASGDPNAMALAAQVIRRMDGLVPDSTWDGVSTVVKMLRGTRDQNFVGKAINEVGSALIKANPVNPIGLNAAGFNVRTNATLADKPAQLVVGDNPLGNAVTAGLNAIDRPLQGVLAAGAYGVNTEKGFNALKRSFSGQTAETLAELDINKDGRIDFLESLKASAATGGSPIGKALGLENINTDGGGAVATVLNLAGEVLLDPFTWVTVGSGQLSQLGMTAVEAELGADVALEAGRKGLKKVLTREEISAVRARIESELVDGLAAGAKKKRAAKLLGLSDEDTARAIAQQQLNAIKRGQGTLAIAGKDIPGSQLIRRAAGHLPGARKVSLFRGATAAEERSLAKADAAALAKRDLQPQQSLFPDTLSLPSTKARLDPAISGVRSTVLSQGIASRARNAPLIRGIQRLMAPRAAIRAAHGSSAAQQIDFLRAAASGESNNAIQDMLTSLTKLAKKADAEMGSDEARRVVRQALDTPVPEEAARRVAANISPDEHVASVIAGLKADGNKRTAKYLEAQAKYRGIMDDAAEVAGLDPKNFRENYMPHILTPEGTRAVNSSPEFRQALFGSSAGDTAQSDVREQLFQKQRTFHPELPVDEANKAAQTVPGYNLKDGEKLFEEDPLAAFAARGRSAFEAAAHADLYNGLTQVVDQTGERIAVWGNTPGAKREIARLKMAPIETAGGTLYVSPDIVKDVVNLKEALTNDETLNALKQLSKEWSGLWATYHTVTLDRGLGFHSRNALGNFMLNAVAGVVNPAYYERAFKIQAGFSRMSKYMKETGATFEEALAHSGMSTKNKKVLVSARDHDILNRGFVGDLGAGKDPGRLRGGIRDRAAQARRSPGKAALGLVADNPLPATGRAVGSAIENNARLAHYIAKLNSLGSADEAAASVRKFLFDYGDLTHAERTTFKKINRFYTFARKNTAVQMWALATRPGRVAGVAKAERSILGLFGGVGPGPAQPDYSLGRGEILAPGLFGDRKDGVTAAIGLDTPLGAAIDVLQPLYLAAQALPGVPGRTTPQEFMQSLHDVMSGPQVALVDLAAETFFGIKTFPAGAPVENRGKEEWTAELLDLLGPSFKSFDRLIGKITAGEGLGPAGNDGPKSWSDFDLSMVILNGVLGMQVTPVSGQSATGTSYAMKELLAEALKEAKRRGHPAPTIQQLRQSGYETGPFIDTPPDLRSPADKAQEAFDSLSPALQSDARQAEITQQKADEAADGLRQDGTTRNTRARALAVENGNVNDAGEGVLNNETKLAYNAANPDDPFLNDDGSVFTQLDVKALQWNMPTATDVMTWARANGADVSATDTSVTKPIQTAYNQAHQAAPYYRALKDRITNGLRPTVGVYFWENPDGTVVEYWPEGLQPSGGPSSP